MKRQWPIETFNLCLVIGIANSSKYILSLFIHPHVDLYSLLPWIIEREIWRLKKFCLLLPPNPQLQLCCIFLKVQKGCKSITKVVHLSYSIALCDGHWNRCYQNADVSLVAMNDLFFWVRSFKRISLSSSQNRFQFQVQFTDSMTLLSSWQFTRGEDYQWISVCFSYNTIVLDFRRLKYSTDNFMIILWYFVFVMMLEVCIHCNCMIK